MFISLNSISPMAKAWEAWGGGGGNIIKLASSTGHDIVQVTGHAFTRVRTLIFFDTDHGTGIGQYQTSLTFL